ncbi:MAG: hypothetical protein KDD22_07455, partial [Bdellovibrionales bacterium]|nr:hypothetical protein [Bdellovibrionales bacterium]
MYPTELFAKNLRSIEEESTVLYLRPFYLSFLLSLLFLFSVSLTLSPLSFAQEENSLTLKAPGEAKEEKPEGWNPLLNLQGNFSFGSNSSVIGQQDGDTTTVGATPNGGYSFYSKKQEWRNSLKFVAATTRTPSLQRYVKSNDELKFESLYFYTLDAYPWIGPYARFATETTAFKGEDVREDITVYQIKGQTETTTASSYRLTDPFKPLTIRESVGIFA